MKIYIVTFLTQEEADAKIEEINGGIISLKKISDLTYQIIHKNTNLIFTENE